MEKKYIGSALKFNEERFTKINVFKTIDCTVFVLNFLSGQKMPEHKHPGCELYLNVLKGEGRFTVDGEEISVTKDDVIHIGGDEMIGFLNDSEAQVSIYVTMNRISQHQ
ncbi:hypothetical protein GCM10022378_03490 [Salinicoccus jeotgali]|uniref:Cupin type-2 domain-containing protein n=1 Tax=Salinicoccus jeotgali TaxID=381634 RepID=A0ABP7ECN8_9STAP